MSLRELRSQRHDLQVDCNVGLVAVLFYFARLLRPEGAATCFRFWYGGNLRADSTHRRLGNRFKFFQRAVRHNFS